MPVRFRAVVRECAIAERATVALRQRLDRVCGGVLQLLGRERNGVPAAVWIVVELAPGHGVVLLAHPEHAAEAHDSEQDVVGSLLEHDVLDFADLVARLVEDVGPDRLAGADSVRMSRNSWHGSAPPCRNPRLYARSVPIHSRPGRDARPS